MRICWGNIRAISNSIRDTVEALFSNESTGYAENIRRYQNEDVHLEAADGLKLDNTIKHVKLVVAKISAQLNDLTKRRKELFSRDMKVKEWRRSEISHYESVTKDLSVHKDRLETLIAHLTSQLSGVKRRFCRSTLEKAADIHKKRRKEQNSIKSSTRKKVRADNGVKNVLKKICPDLPGNQNELMLLKPSKHLSSLQAILDADIFEGDCLEKVEQRFKELEKEAKANSLKYKIRKDRENNSQQQRSSSKQSYFSADLTLNKF